MATVNQAKSYLALGRGNCYQIVTLPVLTRSQAIS